MKKRALSVIAAVVITAVVVFWLVSRALAWGQCAWYGYQTDREVRYAAFVGCMVKVQDHWIPRVELRVVQ